MIIGSSSGGDGDAFITRLFERDVGTASICDDFCVVLKGDLAETIIAHTDPCLLSKETQVWLAFKIEEIGETLDFFYDSAQIRIQSEDLNRYSFYELGNIRLSESEIILIKRVFANTL